MLQQLDEHERIIRKKKKEGAKFLYAPVLCWHYNPGLDDEDKNVSDKSELWTVLIYCFAGNVINAWNTLQHIQLKKNPDSEVVSLSALQYIILYK